MKQIFSPLVVIFTLVLLGVSATQAVFAETQLNLPVYSSSYDEQRDPFKDARAAISLAKVSDRNVLIEIGGNWCSWCKKMDAFLEKNPEVYHALHSKFVILKVSVSDSNENEAFMSALPPVLGYPHMYISTASGKMILSKDTAELQQEGQYSVERWLAFIQAWQANSEQG